VACGAQGELLGELYIIEGEALSWRGQSAEAEQCGARALPLLPRGGPAWCWGAGATFMLRTQLGDIAGAAQILSELGAVTPTREATTPYVKGCALAVGFLCYAGMYEMAQSFLGRIQDAAGETPDSLVSAWAAFARSFVIAFCEGRPLGFHDAVESSLEYFTRAGDARGQAVLKVSLGASLRSLGEFSRAREVLVEAELAARKLGLDLFAASAWLQLGILEIELSNYAAARRLHEQSAADFERQGNQIFAGLARAQAARSLLALGEEAEADRQAEAASDALYPAPAFRALALSVHAEVCLARGDAPRALTRVSEARELLAQLGSIAEGEAHIHLTYARALHAAGRELDARRAIDDACRRLLARAADIADPRLRAQFRDKPCLHARTLELAHAWLGPGRASYSS
jgi:tetratricopeptide (TPR) repeat protein